MGEVRHQAVIRSPRESVFAYVDDYRNVPEYMFGVGRFTPTTEVTQGKDSEFETAIKVGPKELTSTVRCVDWVEGELIRLESVKGFGADTAWSFADGDEPGTTVLDVVFGYTLPGGLAGKVLSGLIGPFAEQGVKHTESKIRAALEV
ncbi:SRPBCC family protein [Gordonia neofelifaecis]|uniref:Polyketide cyclase/dehydrase n=1 Tax=Gordonia neofelifaecis NRRL B-59395 TaxID=644548 RepID=F1YEY5_9ACTN|nr:SRPBCC family protein [Gordonia neofelifaecis]EGD56969.1 polyketide cyclase/dehydrase [Gordonia neofelifaecis NRRL B-59395]